MVAHAVRVGGAEMVLTVSGGGEVLAHAVRVGGAEGVHTVRGEGALWWPVHNLAPSRSPLPAALYTRRPWVPASTPPNPDPDPDPDPNPDPDLDPDPALYTCRPCVPKSTRAA